MNIRGVGSGGQQCNRCITVPVAVPVRQNVHGPTVFEPALRFNFETPVVGGPGADLPALLGLKSMTSRNAVLQMQQGRECLTFPGEGGYEIQSGSRSRAAAADADVEMNQASQPEPRADLPAIGNAAGILKQAHELRLRLGRDQQQRQRSEATLDVVRDAVVTAAPTPSLQELACKPKRVRAVEAPS